MLYFCATSVTSYMSHLDIPRITIDMCIHFYPFYFLYFKAYSIQAVVLSYSHSFIVSLYIFCQFYVISCEIPKWDVIERKGDEKRIYSIIDSRRGNHKWWLCLYSFAYCCYWCMKKKIWTSKTTSHNFIAISFMSLAPRDEERHRKKIARNERKF